MEPETFDNWTGDHMYTSNDLVYKLTLENTTEARVMWKISLEAMADDISGADVNLRWPINGIKGRLGPG